MDEWTENQFSKWIFIGTLRNYEIFKYDFSATFCG